ncbi:MAG: neuraminidase-like domain-containing protein [Nitrospira sp.]
MNLELDVTADESKDMGWRQWASKKQYRVCEANLKIFLYPENWVEPELRDDKSPFFLELENTLLQSDITSESAEQAYVTYLARLDEVARLEIGGVFHQPGEGGAPDEYHAFARTHADPPTYFYRKWVGQARWTPWQRLDLDIPGGRYSAAHMESTALPLLAYIHS